MSVLSTSGAVASGIVVVSGAVTELGDVVLSSVMGSVEAGSSVAAG